MAAYRCLLLAGLLVGAGLRCLAQDGIDFSVAPSLTPALTDADANTAPSTTLSIDLLAPQRTFVYDSTGASVFASALDPTVRVDLLSAESETDTAIRDSSQTGQISPYASGGSRLSTSFSRAASSADSRDGGGASESTIEPTPSSSSADYEQSYGVNSANAVPDGTGATGEGSSWGSSSSSRWGSSSSASARSGGRSSEGVGSSARLDSGSQSGSSIGADQRAVASDDLYRSRPVAMIGWKPAGLTVSRSTSEGVPLAISKGPTTFGAGSTDRFIARPGQSQDPYAALPNSAGSAGADASRQQLFEQAPASFAGTEASAGGVSPFRVLGEGDFLRPNILDSSHLSLAPRASRRSSAEDRSRLKTQGEDEDNPLEASASDYGLQRGMTSSRLRSSRSRSPRGKPAKRINPYLSGDGGGGSEN